MAWAIGGGLAFADSKDSKPDQSPPKADPVAVGSEIFHREWMPNDPRGHGGDGLGPAFNDSSCIACHNSGGSGGAGPVSKNIDILSASRNPGFMAAPNPPPADPAAGIAQLASAAQPGAACPPPDQTAHSSPCSNCTPGSGPGARPSCSTSSAPTRGMTHSGPSCSAATAVRPRVPGVVDGNLVLNEIAFTNVLTREVQTFNTAVQGISFLVDGTNNSKQAKPDPRLMTALTRMNEVKAAVQANRAGMTGTINVGPFVVSRSQRNPTPLFGLGLIDAIPESAIVAMAAKQAKETPEIAGRAARVSDGRIGRLGWKGQTANSEDFVLNACAVEVGLEVPGHSQAMTPQAPRYKGPGLDLTKGECDSLVAYVRSLPRPVERATTSAVEAKYLAAGKEAFAKIGCASCHSAKLGEVEGLVQRPPDPRHGRRDRRQRLV